MQKLLLSFVLCLCASAAFSQWSTDPNLNTQVTTLSGDQVVPKVVAFGDGSCYISWYSLENGNYNVRLQLYDNVGTPVWPTDGIIVSSFPSMTWVTDYNMTVDKEGCAIVGFQDVRNGNNNIHVYRISSNAQFAWGPNGLSLSGNTAFEPYPVIAIPEDNKTVFAWESEDLGQGVIRLQKVMPDSTRLWGPNGIVFKSLNPAEKYRFPSLVESDSNSVILLFYKQTGTYTAPKYLYAQKFDENGNTQWASDVPVYNGSGIPMIPNPEIVSDSAGGLFVAWYDERAGFGQFNCFVQHLDADGNQLMTSGGQAVASNPGIRLYPTIAYLPTTQELFAFFNEENSGQSQWGLYGQKFSPAGQLLWPNGSIAFIPVSNTYITDITARKAISNVLVTWQLYDQGNSMDARILAMLVDAQANMVWTPASTELCNVASQKIHQATGEFLHDQWILAWDDYRDSLVDIYAQNIQLFGDIGPLVTGLPVNTGAENQSLTVFPNPVTNQATISFNGIPGEEVSISLYNTLGEKVAILYNGIVTQTHQSFTWNKKGTAGNKLQTGLYFLELKSSANLKTLKILIPY
ncbi:MAG: T9SS type A sorting domain-containing protein [Bacteroidetes bacterium]|nr:T9SS type A sorting domain-containing protein [Bacteroidota bacterium]